MANQKVLIGDQKINGFGTQGHLGWFTGDTLVNPDGIPIMIAPGIAEGTFADGDTTPDVSAATDWKTANTGSTTITALDGGFAGHRVNLRIGDSNTIVSGALTKSGRTIICQVGDFFEWFHDGASWHQRGGNAGLGRPELITPATVTDWPAANVLVGAPATIDLSKDGVRKGAMGALVLHYFQCNAAVSAAFSVRAYGISTYCQKAVVWQNAYGYGEIFVPLDNDARAQAYFSADWSAGAAINSGRVVAYYI